MLGTLSNIPEYLMYYLVDTTGITNTKRSLMIENMTTVYCTFLEALSKNDLSFVENGLPMNPKTKLSAFQIKSNRWYSKAILSSLYHQKMRSNFYFILALLFNISLLGNKLKRIYCKFIYTQLTQQKKKN